MDIELYNKLDLNRNVVEKIQTDAQLQLIRHLLHRNDESEVHITVNEHYLHTLASLIRKHGPYTTKPL